MKKNKILLSALIGLILVTGCGKEEKKLEKKEKDESKEIRELYKEYIKDKKYLTEYKETNQIDYTGEAKGYTFFDINNDGIEELLIEGTEREYKYKTLIISYNTDEKKPYYAFSSESDSGLLYNKDKNNFLFIARGITYPIIYNFYEFDTNLIGVYDVKKYYNSADSTNNLEYEESNNKKSISKLDAREESEKYEIVQMKYNMDGTEYKEKKESIFKEYGKDAYIVNGKKLQYGTYVSQEGPKITIDLYPDGTCEYDGQSTMKSYLKLENIGCTYSKEGYLEQRKNNQGIEINLMTSDKEYFRVEDDNWLSTQATTLKRK